MHRVAFHRWFLSLHLLVLLGGGVLLAEERPAANKKKGRRSVAIMIFDGVELLDFAGPAEVFIVAEHGRAYTVYTVAATKQPIKTMGGIIVTPQHSIEDAPKPDILVAPGGNTSNVTPKMAKWMRKAADEAEIAMSVCMGAFLFAEAGLLDGREATTHRWGWESLERAAPKCKLVKNRRFVDTGKIITTAGVTAGIDGALHIVERLNGKEAARWTAHEWMEHRTGRFAQEEPTSKKPTSKKPTETP